MIKHSKGNPVNIIKRHGELKSRPRIMSPHTAILHHTAGSSVGGAVAALKNRGLAYHYILDRKGKIYEFVPPMRRASHAYKRNTGTIGISFVGGGKFGYTTALQVKAAIKLLIHLKVQYNIKYVTGHKHVDPRGWKIDPRFEGEPENGVDWNIDARHMSAIAEATGLKFYPRKG